jgi:hypothetical protein
VLAVEGRSCMRGHIDRVQRLPARGIEGVQLVSSSKPDVRRPSMLTDRSPSLRATGRIQV